MPHILADEYQQKCPIWGTPAHVSDYNGHFKKVVSPRVAVPYLVYRLELLDGMFEYIADDDDQHRAKLTTMIIDKSKEAGLHNVNDSYVSQAKEQSLLKVSKRTNRLLKYLVNKSEKNLIGYELHINPDNLQQDMVHYSLHKYLSSDEYIQSVKTCYEALAWSESSTLQELGFLIGQLEAAKLVEIVKVYGQGLSCKVTHQGYLKIEQDIVNKDSSQAFVAMWFGNDDESIEEMDNLYDHGIEQAVKNRDLYTILDRKLSDKTFVAAFFCLL